MRITKSIGMLLLAIWLILYGLIALVHVVLPDVIMPILAIAAGVLILLGR